MVTCSLGFSDERDQPLRVSVLGAPPSHCHGCTVPWSSFTSRYTQMCGFPHSIFVTAPVSVTGLFASNSAENEWCADNAGAAAIVTSATTTVCMVFMRLLLHLSLCARKEIPNPVILGAWRSPSRGSATRR